MCIKKVVGSNPKKREFIRMGSSGANGIHHERRVMRRTHSQVKGVKYTNRSEVLKGYQGQVGQESFFLLSKKINLSKV